MIRVRPFSSSLPELHRSRTSKEHEKHLVYVKNVESWENNSVAESDMDIRRCGEKAVSALQYHQIQYALF